jgi:hypothetical protein
MANSHRGAQVRRPRYSTVFTFIAAGYLEHLHISSLSPILRASRGLLLAWDDDSLVFGGWRYQNMSLSDFRDPAVPFILVFCLLDALVLLFFMTKNRIALVAALIIACAAALLEFIFG